MPDELNLPINNNDNGNQQLGIQNEYNSTITNDEQLIHLPEEATDERTIDPHDMTDEQIDKFIIYPRNYFKEIIFLFYWISNFFYLYINQFLHLLTFVKNDIIAHLFGTYDRQYETEINETQPGYLELPYPYDTLVYRDAEAEGRTAHPTDEPEDDVPYTESVLNNGNDNFIPLDTQNALIDHDINNQDNESQSQDAIDYPTCNINPGCSIESQDNISSSDSSDDEYTYRSCESGFDDDDEGEISDDDLHTSKVSLVNNDVNTDVQDNSRSNRTHLVHEQVTTTGTSSNEVIETIENVTTITESGVYFDRIPVIHLPKILVPKVSGDIHSSDGIEEESII